MKHNWEYKPFDKILKIITPTSKIEKSEYKSIGQYPIISQEDVFISGFWDNEDDITPHSTPVVIFGDHSRVLKYIDFDFVVGADGVKIIQPIALLNAKFLYHFLRWYKVPSLGYSRHFKLLKETNYPVPGMEVQERIVAELDQINDLIAKSRELLSQLDALTKSLFYDTFGDPVSNPKGWKIKTIKEISTVLGGSTPKTGIEEYWNGDLLWITPAELRGIKYIYDTERHITELGRESAGLQIMPINTVLLTSRAPIGKVAIAKAPMYCNQGFKNLICDSQQVHFQYVYSFLSLITDILNEKGTGATFKEISKKVTESISIPVPPLELQEEFARKVEAIEAEKARVVAEIKELQTLLDARMDFWFN